MNHFCTYCDRGYVARLLCLYDSFLAQKEAFQLSVLCFDADTEAIVSSINSPSLIAIPLAELLAADSEFAGVRGKRTKIEFYFTATPVLVRHCLSREPHAGRMTYLDSDLFFFGPASAVFSEQKDASVGIVPHRFPPRLEELLKWGTYNVAWVSFCRDRDGLACLEWWREKCLEWCHDYLDGGRFADQGYLNEFSQRFAGVNVVNHPGINAAPWNMEDVRIGSEKGRLYVNDQPLLFFHFQGVRELLPGWFEPGLRIYQTRFTPELRDAIYLPYLKKLVATQSHLQATHGIGSLLGYQRLPAGKSLRECSDRFAARWLRPYYRRMRGQLLHCPQPMVPRSSGMT